jgi:DNA-binding Xre family transcriptional regulator
MTIRWHLKELIGRAESISGSSISYRDISAATGISTNTITQMATGKARRVDLSTVDRLLAFLGEKIGEHLTIDDLVKRP